MELYAKYGHGGFTLTQKRHHISKRDSAARALIGMKTGGGGNGRACWGIYCHSPHSEPFFNSSNQPFIQYRSHLDDSASPSYKTQRNSGSLDESKKR